MVQRRWFSQHEEAENEAVFQEPGSLSPSDSGSVIASAKLFVLEDQARSKAANADAVPFRERRKPTGPVQDEISLRAGLTPQQLAALVTLEQFRWTLRFVRRPMFHAPIPIVFSPDATHFIVIEADGSINDNPGFKLRP